MGPSVHELKEFHWDVVVPFLPYLIPAMLMFAAAFVWGVIALRRNRRAFVILLVWLTIPVVLTVVLSLLNLKAPNSRYAIIAFTPYLLFVAAGVATISHKYLRWVVLGVLLFYCSQAFPEPHRVLVLT